MKFFKKIISFFKNLFTKDEEIKRLEQPVDLEGIYENFRNSLKTEGTTVEKRKEVESLVSIGDGLGIQNKLTY